jgi:hypothetical protein
MRGVLAFGEIEGMGYTTVGSLLLSNGLQDCSKVQERTDESALLGYQ